MPGQFFDNFLMKIPPEKTVEIRDSMKRLAIAMFQIGNAIRENYSEETLNESLRIVDEASKKFEELRKKTKGGKA